MVNSDKLVKLRSDLDSKLGFFDYKASRFSNIIKKELNKKLSDKISSLLDVQIYNDKSNSFLPIIRINIDNNFLHISNLFDVYNCDAFIYRNREEYLDKAILVGFLASSVKSRNKTYDVINKYLKILISISCDLNKLSNHINDEIIRLNLYRENKKTEVIDDFISEGVEFILFDNRKIFGKKIAERKYGEGILLTIIKKEKKSYHVTINGRRLKSRYTFELSPSNSKFKISKKRLVETIKELIIDNVNPEFERALILSDLVSN